MLDRLVNFPMPHHNHTIFHGANWVWSSHGKGEDDNKSFNLALSLSTAGYYHCKDTSECGDDSFQQKRRIQERMDNAPASFHGEMFVPPVGEFHYKCLRNDNFSNRSQKGTIRVVSEAENAVAQAANSAVPGIAVPASFGRKKRSVRTSGGRPAGCV